MMTNRIFAIYFILCLSFTISYSEIIVKTADNLQILSVPNTIVKESDLWNDQLEIGAQTIIVHQNNLQPFSLKEIIDLLTYSARMPKINLKTTIQQKYSYQEIVQLYTLAKLLRAYALQSTLSELISEYRYSMPIEKTQSKPFQDLEELMNF